MNRHLRGNGKLLLGCGRSGRARTFNLRPGALCHPDPELFDAVAAKDERRIRRVLGLWFAVVVAGSAAGVVLIGVFAKPFVSVLLGRDFGSADRLVSWIAGAYALQNVQQVFETVIHARRNTRRLPVVQLVGGVAALSLYLILIPRFGGLGAAVATLGALLASCLTAAILSGFRRGWNEPGS